MLSLERCKEILKNGKRKYPDEELKRLREFLYLIAELQLENEKEIK